MRQKINRAKAVALMCALSGCQTEQHIQLRIVDANTLKPIRGAAVYYRSSRKDIIFGANSNTSLVGYSSYFGDLQLKLPHEYLSCELLVYNLDYYGASLNWHWGRSECIISSPNPEGVPTFGNLSNLSGLQTQSDIVDINEPISVRLLSVRTKLETENGIGNGKAGTEKGTGTISGPP